MNKIIKANNDVYKFIGGDMNPTVKKIGKNNDYTNEIYNKDQIIDTLKIAVKSGKTKSVIKQISNDEKNINYIFNFDDNINQQLITISVENQNFNELKDNEVLLSNTNLNDSKYVKKLDELKTATLKLKLRNNIGKIGFILATATLITASMAYSVIKEDEVKDSMRDDYFSNINSERVKNGLEPMGEQSQIEETVDEAILEMSMGRTL